MKTQTCKTAAVMGLLSRGPAAAPAHAAGDAPAPGSRTIDEITADILQAKQAGGEAVLAIGRGLIEAKTILNHGEWLPWLSERVEFSERTAQNFMRLAREWSNPQALADLGAAKALTLLALPETERAAFAAETHLVDGEEKTVIDMTSRELEKAVRERAEALAAKEKAETELKAMEDAAAKTMTSLDQANRARYTLQKELDELKSRPVEVAIQVDQEAVEKAREEGYQQARKELKTAEKAAGEQVSKANADAASIKTELQKKQKEVEDLQFELARAREKLEAPAEPAKPSPLSTDADLAQFKLLFDQAKTIVNQMHGLLLRVRGQADSEKAGKLSAALRALGESVGRCAE